MFNGWGQQKWATWEHDATIAGFVGGCAGAEVVPSSLVNEGGGIHVDGLGTVLLTETVQLDEGRNPAWTKADVESELARTIGTSRCVWLPRGLTRDYDEFGTGGHVDIVATIASPGIVLLHDQHDPSHPDHAVSGNYEEILSAAHDARRAVRHGRRAGPTTLHDEEGPVDWSYINHLVVNGGVIACTFDDPTMTAPSACSPRPTRGVASSASTPDRCSPAVAASTASPSNNRQPERRGHPSTGTVSATSLR